MIRDLFAAAAVVGVIAGVAIGAAPAATATPYPDCKTAAKDGRYNIPSDDPAYQPGLDSDNDGIGCEKKN
jgi:Excalibur calcium-binding domain